VRGAKAHLLAAQDYRAGCRRLGAGNDLDQARFAGTVVAANRQHLAAEDIEIDIPYGDDRTIALADPAQGQDRRFARFSHATAPWHV